MWEEDPRWQQAHYKVFLYALCLFTVLAPIVSAFTGNWGITRSYFMGIGILAAAVCLYIVVVWTAVRALMLVVWLCKKFLAKAHRH